MRWNKLNLSALCPSAFQPTSDLVGLIKVVANIFREEPLFVQHSALTRTLPEPLSLETTAVMHIQRQPYTNDVSIERVIDKVRILEFNCNYNTVNISPSGLLNFYRDIMLTNRIGLNNILLLHFWCSRGRIRIQAIRDTFNKYFYNSILCSNYYFFTSDVLPIKAYW